ncbi:terminase ATPase subunit family protein [Chitiniphilus eburneus]|uniref:terminase ATPase subunit family protein n=1 Tax=Chitiniphilus eburneus TaxID=2571148 RepID=UPI0035CEE7F8
MLDDADFDPRRRARDLYWTGLRVARIAEMLGIKPQTIHSWKYRDGWDEVSPVERVSAVTEARYIQLVNMPKKGNGEYKEMDALLRAMERTARVTKYQGSGKEADLNPNIERRNAAPKRKPERNVISDDQLRRMREAFRDGLFGYQQQWWRAGQTERIRNLLKSRQIGATWYFSQEALIDALDTGRNQIFLSASKAQALQFKSYVKKFAHDTAEVELTGENILLPNGAELIFLGTNSRTAQSYHGNLYVDEYFWIPRFTELRKVASGMASQKRWRSTYFSTPSALSHEAYPFWSGALFNRGRAKADRVQFDVTHEALAAGRHCEDGQWRQIVTILDALAGGCDLFDLDQLRLEYSPEELAQLFMCQFIDDGASVFPLSLLQRCMVDSLQVWDDYKPFALRPLGNREVWIGYDPNNGGGDSAAMVVIAPPAVPGGKFRLIERMQFRNKLDYEGQAAQIKAACGRYNVTFVGIDTTGAGQGVYQIVRQFFPTVTGYHYSLELKTRMVLKALNVIHNGRLEFDAGWTDLAASFMAIKQVSTPSGRQMTYQAGRAEDINHADLAWATMHALAHEPLEGVASGSGKAIMEFI